MAQDAQVFVQDRAREKHGDRAAVPQGDQLGREAGEKQSGNQNVGIEDHAHLMLPRPADRGSDVLFRQLERLHLLAHAIEPSLGLDDHRFQHNRLAVQADLADPATPARLFDAAEQAFGGVDILVNNAGIMELGPLAEVTDEAFARFGTHNVNGRETLGQFVEIYVRHIDDHLTFVRGKRERLGKPVA